MENKNEDNDERTMITAVERQQDVADVHWSEKLAGGMSSKRVKAVNR